MRCKKGTLGIGMELEKNKTRDWDVIGIENRSRFITLIRTMHKRENFGKVIFITDVFRI